MKSQQRRRQNGSSWPSRRCRTPPANSVVATFFIAVSLAGIASFLPVITADELLPTNIPKSIDSSLAFQHPIGRLHDAACNVEEIEHANEGQLYCILQELSNTSFFRNFVVDLDHGCPLTNKHDDDNTVVEKGSQILKKKVDASKSESIATTTLSTSAHSEPPTASLFPVQQGLPSEGTCSGGLPEFMPAENNGKQACDIEYVEPSSGMLEELPPLAAQGASEEPKSSATSDVTKEQEGDFECATSQEEEDEPLCEIKEDDNSFLSRTPLTGFFSSALKAIWDAVGWESESQKETFAWSAPSDFVVSERGLATESCAEDIEAAFWMDMCSQIKAGEGTRVVNLVSNPERNTGYNGTHIWKAIYDENCMALDGNTSEPMCYEERILFRLLSGMHTSTSVSIAKYYFPPSSRKGRPNWEPNPIYFMEKFGNHPEYIRNLYFSYVVLLRALRKAKPFLYKYEIYTGDIVDDETASILLKRLLDSHILSSCSNVFSAFDESLMFKESSILVEKKQGVPLQQNFKGVFHNISSILDCVRCEKCKLHGKMTMLGYGAALKILFLPESAISSSSLSRNEIVAFINTIIKFSESIKDIRELTHLYWESNKALPQHSSTSTPIAPSLGSMASSELIDNTAQLEKWDDDLVDAAIGAIAKLCRDEFISNDRETELVSLALRRDPAILIIAKYYATDLNKFLIHSKNLAATSKDIGASSVVVSSDTDPDAIVVGSGLAGLAVTLNILDRGGSVILIEKEHTLGGNSAKASSGINACCPHGDKYGDNLETFARDTVKSAGIGARLPLINTLTGRSAEAVEWLRRRTGVDLSVLAQLGGHSYKRTYRPSNGMVGAEIIYGMQKEVKKFETTGKVKILLDTHVVKLLFDGERVTGVKIKSSEEENNIMESELTARNVILATGGFASDRSTGSYLDKYRPELMQMPATAGDFSTGDGIRMATELEAGVVDMDKIQLHPTGWIDDSDPFNPTKILAAELMRGVGGILLNSAGKRFCNELGTRAYVTEKMLEHNPAYKLSKNWDKNSESPVFSLILSSSAAKDGEKHVRLYNHKGLLHKLHGTTGLAEWMEVDVATVRETMTHYQADSLAGKDVWGKTSFQGVPAIDLDNEIFYAGKVTPVLHYCMGGITIDTEGNVLRNDGSFIKGLHAAGEVSGGVHGDNRLGGNSLLECTVFGTIVGQKIPVKVRNSPIQSSNKELNDEVGQRALRQISPVELARHNSPEDCWVAIHGSVYNLTGFAEEHPPGAKSIWDVAGMDATEAFEVVHSKGILDDFEDVLQGVLIS